MGLSVSGATKSGFSFPEGILAGSADGFPFERLGVGGSFLLSQSLHEAGIFHGLDGGLVVLRFVAHAGVDGTEG